MKCILTFMCIVVFTQVQAQESWGSEKFIIPTKENEKLSDYLARKTYNEKKNYKLQAEILCNYLEKNSFIDLVSNKTFGWGPSFHPKNPLSLYSKASEAADKAMSIECSKKEPFYGNIQQAIWGALLQACRLKDGSAGLDKECSDYATRYLERSEMVSKTAFATINFSANQKNENSLASVDCAGTVSSVPRNHLKPKAKESTNETSPVVPSFKAVPK